MHIITKYFHILLTGFFLTSCSTKSADVQQNGLVIEGNKEEIKVHNILQDTSKVKSWLIEIIEGYTNGVDLKAAYAKMRSSLTNEYYNYKQDAINLEYDSPEGSMTEEEFNKKWSGKFNTKFVGKGGFFIASNDNGKVKVTTCLLLKNFGDTATLFHVVIDDLDFKTKFIRDFKVIGRDNKLFISDIIEYD